METIYLGIVIFLFMLAVFDLMLRRRSQSGKIQNNCYRSINRRICRSGIKQRHDGHCEAWHIPA